MSSASDFLCPHCGMELSIGGLEPGTVVGCPSCDKEFRLPGSQAVLPAPQSGLPPRRPPRSAPPADAPAAPESTGFPQIDTGSGSAGGARGPRIRTERTSVTSRASSYADRDRRSTGRRIMIRLIFIAIALVIGAIMGLIEMAHD